MTLYGVTTYFHYDGTTTYVLYETDANNVVKVHYTYDSKGNHISMTYNGQPYFYQYNGHGDVVGLIDSTGTVMATYDYDAFGNPVGAQPVVGSVGDVNPYRYAGYRWDKDTGLYYLNARYYWADLGRFITRDSFNGVGDNPSTLNLYNYCNDNPIAFTDSTGHLPVWGNPCNSFSAYDSLNTGDLIARLIYGEIGAKELLRSAWAVGSVLINRLRSKDAADFGMHGILTLRTIVTRWGRDKKGKIVHAFEGLYSTRALRPDRSTDKWKYACTVALYVAGILQGPVQDPIWQHHQLYFVADGDASMKNGDHIIGVGYIKDVINIGGNTFYNRV